MTENKDKSEARKDYEKASGQILSTENGDKNGVPFWEIILFTILSAMGFGCLFLIVIPAILKWLSSLTGG